MPLHVLVYTNNQISKTFHIGRREGEGFNNSVNAYEVVIDRSEDPESDVDWDAGTQFTHRYGDGRDICITRAIQAAAGQDDTAHAILDELEFRRHEATIDQRAGGTMTFTVDDAIDVIKKLWAPNHIPVPQVEPR